MDVLSADDVAELYGTPPAEPVDNAQPAYGVSPFAACPKVVAVADHINNLAEMAELLAEANELPPADPPAQGWAIPRAWLERDGEAQCTWRITPPPEVTSPADPPPAPIKFREFL